MGNSVLGHSTDEAWNGDEALAPEASRMEDSPTSASDGLALLVRDLGWSPAEAMDTHARLRPFEEDWNAPGMDAYDDL